MELDLDSKFIGRNSVESTQIDFGCCECEFSTVLTVALLSVAALSAAFAEAHYKVITTIVVESPLLAFGITLICMGVSLFALIYYLDELNAVEIRDDDSSDGGDGRMWNFDQGGHADNGGGLIQMQQHDLLTPVMDQPENRTWNLIYFSEDDYSNKGSLKDKMDYLILIDDTLDDRHFGCFDNSNKPKFCDEYESTILEKYKELLRIIRNANSSGTAGKTEFVDDSQTFFTCHDGDGNSPFVQLTSRFEMAEKKLQRFRLGCQSKRDSNHFSTANESGNSGSQFFVPYDRTLRNSNYDKQMKTSSSDNLLQGTLSDLTVLVRTRTMSKDFTLFYSTLNPYLDLLGGNLIPFDVSGFKGKVVTADKFAYIVELDDKQTVDNFNQIDRSKKKEYVQEYQAKIHNMYSKLAELGTHLKAKLLEDINGRIVTSSTKLQKFRVLASDTGKSSANIAETVKN